MLKQFSQLSESQMSKELSKEVKNGWLSLVVFLLAPFLAASVGGFATQTSVDTWYKTLRKPAWNPPAWVFGPVWTTLYTLMGIASWLVWRSNAGKKHPDDSTLVQHQPSGVQGALQIYGIQLALNALWSILFFGARRIRWAFAELLVLWGMIAVTLVRFYRIKPIAGWLLVPYLLWSTFAAFLNATIWRMNRVRAE